MKNVKDSKDSKNSKIAKNEKSKTVKSKSIVKKSKSVKKGDAVKKSAKSTKSTKPVKSVKTAAEKSAKAVETTTTPTKKAAVKIVSNRQIITGSTHGKLQQRTVGSRRAKNSWGHFEGTIGAKIDNMISKENFTKKQIQAFAGTKMSKVNSHIHHLRKEKMFSVKIDSATKIVSFG